MTAWNWNRCVLALACVSLCALAVAQDAPSTKPAGTPHLELGAKEWSFGEVWQGEPESKEISVKNTGDAPLEIDVKSSCGCTVATKPKSPLPPGESTSLTITYNTAGKMGPANQTVTVTTNDPTQQSTAIKVTGNVMPLYEMDPKDGISFGQLWQDSQQTNKLTIVNKYRDKLNLKLKEGQDFGQFAIELKELDPGMRYELTATPKPPLKVGRFQVEAALTTGIERIPEIKAQIYGFVQAPVSVRPAKLFLPKNSVSEMKRVLRVTHAANQAIAVTGAKSTDDAIKVELVPTTQPAGEGKGPQEYQILVVLPPGDRIADGAEPKIEITTNAKDPEFQKLVVPVQIVTTRPRPPASQPLGGAAPTTAPGAPAPAPAPQPARETGQKAG